MRVSLDEGAYMPERAHDTDAGADIRTPVDVTVPARGSAIIRTGVHVQLPQGTVGMLKSKSGLNVNHGITSEGVIDEGYTGEVTVKAYNNTDTPYMFRRGDKVTQLVVMPVYYVGFELVDMVDGGTRGLDGFGSTGR